MHASTAATLTVNMSVLQPAPLSPSAALQLAHTSSCTELRCCCQDSAGSLVDLLHAGALVDDVLLKRRQVLFITTALLLVDRQAQLHLQLQRDTSSSSTL